MKLKNKLLPIVGIAATAATATPLVALTSCGSTLSMVDLTKGYQPTFDQHEFARLGQNSANADYIKTVKANNEIFKQDFLYGTFTKFNNMFNQTITSTYSSVTYKLKSLKAGCSTPVFGMTNVSYPGEPDVQYPTISLDMQYEFEIGIEYFNQRMNDYQGINIKANVGVGYKNVPFYGTNESYYRSKGSDVAFWQFGIPGFNNDSFVYRWCNNGWTISYDFNGTMDVTSMAPKFSDVKTETIQMNQSETVSTYKQMQDFILGSAYNVEEYQQLLLELEKVEAIHQAGSITQVQYLKRKADILNRLSALNVSGYTVAYQYLFNNIDNWYDTSSYEWKSINYLKVLLPVEFASLMYGSYYMNEVLSKPEFFSTGNASINLDNATLVTPGQVAEGDTIIIGQNRKVSDSWVLAEFPLSMSYATYLTYRDYLDGYNLYGDINSAGEPTGGITIEMVDNKDNKLTIAEGSAPALFATESGATYQNFGLTTTYSGETLKADEDEESTTFTFKLPKYIVVQPVVSSTFEWTLEPQKVYLNQDEIEITFYNTSK